MHCSGTTVSISSHNVEPNSISTRLVIVSTSKATSTQESPSQQHHRTNAQIVPMQARNKDQSTVLTDKRCYICSRHHVKYQSQSRRHSPSEAASPPRHSSSPCWPVHGPSSASPSARMKPPSLSLSALAGGSAHR